MVFTPVGGGATTIGLGQMQERGGFTQMEMQMITGTSLLVSHWAYMLPYDPATFTPPPAQAVPSNSSPQWAWTAGTPWRIVSPAAFGTAAPGTFIITNYKNGYFWGEGKGPSGGASFTLLGSITPEGKVLFNTLTNGQLTSLYGDVTGDASAALMLLGAYDASALFTGDLTSTYLVRPYAETVTATGTRSALGAAETLYAIAGTSAGLTGDMAPAIAVLNDLNGPALSAAISQTLPVLAGAACARPPPTPSACIRTGVESRSGGRARQIGGIDARTRATCFSAAAAGRRRQTRMHTTARRAIAWRRRHRRRVSTPRVAPRLTVSRLFAYASTGDSLHSTDWANANAASGFVETSDAYVLGHLRRLCADAEPAPHRARSKCRAQRQRHVPRHRLHGQHGDGALSQLRDADERRAADRTLSLHATVVPLRRCASAFCRSTRTPTARVAPGRWT